MKKNLVISLILLLFAFSSKSQQSDTLMNRLSGKWNWYSSEDGWGHYYTPANSGYTRSIIFYQTTPDSGTDSLSYLTYRNDTVIASGRTYIVNTYKNEGEIFSNILLEDTSVYNECKHYNFGFSPDSYLVFGFWCITDYFNHLYKKDTLYNHVIDDVSNTFFKIYPNPAKNYLQVDFYNSEVQFITYEIINSSGRIVLASNIMHSINYPIIDISALPKGCYTIRFKIKNKIISRKIIID